MILPFLFKFCVEEEKEEEHSNAHHSSSSISSLPAQPLDAHQRSWKIDLASIGDESTCIYSYICCCCALADARTILDGSNWYVNCIFIRPATARWLIRTAYNIPGNASDDCNSGIFYPCCTVNQLLQTIRHYGRIENTGSRYNINPRFGVTQRSFESLAYDILYAYFCRRCAVGIVMESVGMPFWFGACCVGIYEANSILRYHHRYHPMWDNELYPDLLFPLLFAPIVNQCPAIYLTGMLAETNAKVGRTYCYGCEGSMDSKEPRQRNTTGPPPRYLAPQHFERNDEKYV